MVEGIETEQQAGLTVPTLSAAPAPMGNPGTPADTQEASEPFGTGSGIAHPIPIPKKASEWESGYQNEHGPRPSVREAWLSTPFQQGMRGTLLSPWGGALTRMAQEQDAASGKMLSPEQANQLDPGRPVPYTTPVDAGTAAMEMADRQKNQALVEWAAQRPMTFMGKVLSKSVGMVGGLTDPLNFAIGAMSGGVSEMLAPEAAGLAGKLAVHYLANLGGFTATDALQNLAEHQMGAKQKQFGELVGENAVPALIGTAVGVGMSAVARAWANRGGGTSEVDINGIKKTVAALEEDKRPPQLEAEQRVIEDRRAGTTIDPSGNKIKPTTLTSPLQETPMYGATHSDGTPLIHEHGLGKDGVQVTDSQEVARNGVATSTETPGQIHETKLPEGMKTLDIDRSASEDYNSKDSFLKEVEAKTGIPLDASVLNGESIKDVITNLGDWSGAEIGKGKTVPDDILRQIQEIAKSQGFGGYEFSGPNSRQVHIFDPSGMSVSKSYTANPQGVPSLPEDSTPTTRGNEPQNTAVPKTERSSYSPEVDQAVHDFRKKNTIFDPHSPEHIAEIQKDIEQYKQQLSDMAKESPTAAETLADLKKEEIKDQRLRDIAKRIAGCGQGGGL